MDGDFREGPAFVIGLAFLSALLGAGSYDLASHLRPDPRLRHRLRRLSRLPPEGGPTFRLRPPRPWPGRSIRIFRSPPTISI